MKKCVILLIFSVIYCGDIISQGNVPAWVSAVAYDSFEDYYLRKNKEEQKALKSNHIQSRTSITQNKNKTSRCVETFNQNGNLISIQFFNQENNSTGIYSYTYDNQNRITRINYNLKKKNAWSEIMYDKSGTLIRSRGYTYKGEYKGREEFKREDGKVLSVTEWKKDSISPIRRLTYDYYEDGSLKQINYYYKSEKKYTWNYDCKPEGELIDKKNKELSTICISEERDENGNLIKWHRQFNSKGEIEKIRMVFKNDSILISQESFDIDDILRSKRIYFHDGGYLYYSYSKKGKITSTNETIYNSEHQLIRNFSSYGNYFYSRWIEYDGELPKTITSVSKKGTSITTYQYQNFE